MAAVRAFLRDHGHVVLAVSLVLFVGLVAANVVVMDGAGRVGAQFGPAGATDTTVVVVAQVPAHPGERIYAPGPGFAHVVLSDVVPLDRLDFYVVEGGEGTLLLAGERPPHVYAEQRGLALVSFVDAISEAFSNAGSSTDLRVPTGIRNATEVSLVRPDVPAGVDPEMCLIPSPDIAHWDHAPCVDVVWVYSEAAGGERVLANMTAGERGLVAQLASRVIIGPLAGAPLVVFPSWTLAAQRGLYAGQGLALVGIVVGGAGFLLARRPATVAAEGDETEALVAVVNRGGQVLRRLRDLVAVGGLLLLPFGLLAWRSIARPTPFEEGGGLPGWSTWLAWESGLALLALAALWIASWWMLHRAARRWRTISSRPPLGP